MTSAHLPDSTTDSWSAYYSNQRQDVSGGKPFGSKVASLKQRCRDYDGRNGVNHLFLFVSSLFSSLSSIPSNSPTISEPFFVMTIVQVALSSKQLFMH